ncbi:hypothetical protein CY34DRAFT_25812 [Suillus luteus UH-Slu-Lm8-n1]|uniref:Uncharacterized protein n=1 Tax=Suillus luteus UH-Slu-Lm8-n1 TaxID=930992 RepID=A0A0C9ZKK8_9AGAM|nr:hypothetical protein CY34DRAFT_25812 [Suillus luteus UH-Slu-Lm8-n1]
MDWKSDSESNSGESIVELEGKELESSLAQLRNETSIAPQKLAKFTNNKLLHTEATKYVEGLVQTEMPQGLKRYIELELFPCIYMKVRHEISLSTAHCWLHHEGFQFMVYKNGLYFNDHDQPDVLCDKIITAFKHAYGPGYQALFFIDNSQGHSAYVEDVLLFSPMNINLGSKQAWMKAGWFIDAGRQKV